MEETLEDSFSAELVGMEHHGMAFGTMATVNGVGDFASSVLRTTSIGKGFFGARGVSLDRGLMDLNPEEVRAKREMADVRGFKMGDEGIDYIINQMIEFLLISRNIEEVFAEDHTIRRKIYQVFKKHLDVDEDIDREARSRLKHLSEGTQAWEVEYQKTVEQIRRNKGLA